MLSGGLNGPRVLVALQGTLSHQNPSRPTRDSPGQLTRQAKETPRGWSHTGRRGAAHRSFVAVLLASPLARSALPPCGNGLIVEALNSTALRSIRAPGQGAHHVRLIGPLRRPLPEAGRGPPYGRGGRRRRRRESAGCWRSSRAVVDSGVPVAYSREESSRDFTSRSLLDTAAPDRATLQLSAAAARSSITLSPPTLRPRKTAAGTPRSSRPQNCAIASPSSDITALLLADRDRASSAMALSGSSSLTR